MSCEHEARAQLLERKLQQQRQRSRRLKTELREARQAIVMLCSQVERQERIWHAYLARNGFKRLFTLYANCQAAARMMGLSVEQFAHLADRCSIAEIREMVADLTPRPKRER